MRTACEIIQPDKAADVAYIVQYSGEYDSIHEVGK
jgi:hypothetical protein